MTDKQRIHVLCSSNWNPRFPDADPNKMLGPLRTMISYIERSELRLSRVILIKGAHQSDGDYCSLVQNDLAAKGTIATAFEIDNGSPANVASHVSNAASRALLDDAELWTDLTPGPKDRTALIFAAASAVPGVKIAYSEAVSNQQFEVRFLPRLDSYNQWLGRHGILIRNYCEELRSLAQQAADSNKGFNYLSLLSAISDLLGSQASVDVPMLSPRTDLLKLAEWISNTVVPANLLQVSRALRKWQTNTEGKACDQDIRNYKDEWFGSAGRASQLVYQLRCLHAHPRREGGRNLEQYDAVALLDGLAFLAARLKAFGFHQAEIATQENVDTMYIAVDGDDVGRRFEERLADCLSAEQADALRFWSRRMQQELSLNMINLMESWDGSFLARTGDGFLATISAMHFDDVKERFRPTLLDATVTTGIGRSVKEAYLALKLGKARNRGGGTYFSLSPPEEQILWQDVERERESKNSIVSN